MDDDLEHVFELMVSRSRGEAQTDDVEDAVSKLLQKQSQPATTTTAASKQQQQCGDAEIQQDLDNYDNLEEPSLDEKKPPVATTNTKSGNTTTVASFPEATLESMLRQDDDNDSKVNPLERIPMGIMASRMMVTFGDGPQPNPAAVQEALLGARHCLLIAIKDARALRRQEKQEYVKARQIAVLSSKQGKLRGGGKFQASDESASASILYRAMQGWDKLAYDPKCGFDVEQLSQLFPEEIQAFQKWNEMHSSYQEASKDSDVTGVLEHGNTPDGSNGTANQQHGDTTNKPAVKSDVPVAEGHLEERAAQFDARTDQMQDAWYLKFAEVRKGSFLPKSGMKKADEREWNSKTKKRGRPKAGTSWQGMSSTSVRFLHWIGFDPSSLLPPPSEEVTEALAFLAYDFMGRIVEKSIYLRNIAKKDKDGSNEEMLLELSDGEQLEASDIRKAINDSTIKPVPLYNSLDNDDESSSVAASLYFGPGFEDRLEMEMEELASGKKRKARLSPEELEIRQREDALFSKLVKEPPVFEGFANVVNEKKGKEDEVVADDVAAPNEQHEERGVASK